jgi:hypothetical protein
MLATAAVDSNNNQVKFLFIYLFIYMLDKQQKGQL